MLLRHHLGKIYLDNRKQIRYSIDINKTFKTVLFKQDFKKSGVNFIQKKTIQKKLSANKSRKKFYPEVLSKKIVIQNVRDLFYITLHY